MTTDGTLFPQIQLTDEIRAEIRGAVAEIDRAQMAIIARLSPEQRARQALVASGYVLGVEVERLRKAEPSLTEPQARRLALEEYYRRNPTTYLPIHR